MSIRESLMDVSSGFVGLVQTRLELFTLEAAQQKSRVMKTMLLAFAALIFLTLALLVFSILITIYFWPTEYRFLALGLLCLAYAVIGFGLLLSVRSGMVNAPAPFEATLSELRRDAQMLRRTRAAPEAPASSGGRQEGAY